MVVAVFFIALLATSAAQNCELFTECDGCLDNGCQWCQSVVPNACQNKTIACGSPAEYCRCNNPWQTNCFDCLNTSGSTCVWALCPGDDLKRCINPAAQPESTCQVLFDKGNPCTGAQCADLTYCTDCQRFSDKCAYCPDTALCQDVTAIDPDKCGEALVGAGCARYCSSFHNCTSCQEVGESERLGCAWADGFCFDVVLHPYGESVEFQSCNQPTPAPAPDCSSGGREFDTASFFGGIILAFGLTGIGYFLIFHCGKGRAGYADLDKVAPTQPAPVASGVPGVATPIVSSGNE